MMMILVHINDFGLQASLTLCAHWTGLISGSKEGSSKLGLSTPVLALGCFTKTLFSKKIVHTFTCPSGVYINQIQKLFSLGQV